MAEQTNTTDEFDYGLISIAKYLGKEEALSEYREGAALEACGQVDAGIVKYRSAFKKWRELDSVVTAGGLPRDVRRQLEMEMSKRGEIARRLPGMIHVVDLALANSSPLVEAEALFTESDLAEVDRAIARVLDLSNPLENNPQNIGHFGKQCLMLSNDGVMDDRSPFVSKLRSFAASAWNKFGSGPLAGFEGGVDSLNIRVIEAWTYEIGGGLTDPSHYDNNSVLTLVTALTDQDKFEGGLFRTRSGSGEDMVWREHPLGRGDCICFVSHKVHTVTPVTKGRRKSLVMELWEGPSASGRKGRDD